MSLALRVAPNTPPSTDQELVTAVRAGDDRSFEELYTRYRTRVARYVLGMVRDHGRAEDITQEVFISALRRMRDTERPIAFKPWIYEIAKNACIDHARRTRPGREVPLEYDEDAPTDLRPVASEASVERTVEAKQQLNDLRGAFGCLSESHHQILVMRELEGLSYQQIGERLGISRAVVESTLFRARRRLGEEYEELVSGRRCAHVQAVVADPQKPALGLRERRRLARHLAHCQPCRRHAHLAGFDDSFLRPTTLAGKIAALLPLPLVRVRELWRGRGRGSGGSGLQSARIARSADAVTRLADPSVMSSGFGRVATAIVAAALTGAGSGILISGTGGSTAHRAPASAPGRAAPAAQVAPPTTHGVRRVRRQGMLPRAGGGGATPKVAYSTAAARGSAGAGHSALPSPMNPSSKSSPSGPPAGAGGSGSGSALATSNAGSAGGHSPRSTLPSIPVQLPKSPALSNLTKTVGSLPLPSLPSLPPPTLPQLPSLPQLPRLPQVHQLAPAPEVPHLSVPSVPAPSAVGGLLPHVRG